MDKGRKIVCIVLLNNIILAPLLCCECKDAIYEELRNDYC